MTSDAVEAAVAHAECVTETWEPADADLKVAALGINSLDQQTLPPAPIDPADVDPFDLGPEYSDGYVLPGEKEA